MIFVLYYYIFIDIIALYAFSIRYIMQPVRI